MPAKVFGDVNGGGEFFDECDWISPVACQAVRRLRKFPE